MTIPFLYAHLNVAWKQKHGVVVQVLLLLHLYLPTMKQVLTRLMFKHWVANSPLNMRGLTNLTIRISGFAGPHSMFMRAKSGSKYITDHRSIAYLCTHSNLTHDPTV